MPDKGKEKVRKEVSRLCSIREAEQEMNRIFTEPLKVKIMNPTMKGKRKGNERKNERKWEIPGQTYRTEYRSQIVAIICHFSNMREWVLEMQGEAVKKSVSPLVVLSSCLSFPSSPCPHKCLKTKPSGKTKFFFALAVCPSYHNN